ncbi:MAG: DUF4097 family beta strand repeat-containing protein [Vicinamibacterales bacterium]
MNVVLALLAVATMAEGAVTNRGVLTDDGPRAGWLDRYAEARQGPEQVDRATQSFKVGNDGSLDISGISGDVRVTGGSGNTIVVESIKRVRHRDPEEAKRMLAALRVEITQTGSRVEVRTVYPRNRDRSWDRGMSASVDYIVSVPASAMAAVKSISGDVIVSSVKGQVRAETISGDVSVTATPNLALAKTVSGDVIAKDIGGASLLTLSTISGSVIATGLNVRELECGSVSGDVRIAGVQVERALAKSVSGSIEFDAPLSRGGRYEFTTHSGNVRLVLPAAPGFELDANSFSGSIRSDLPVTLRPGSDSDDRRRGTSRRAIRGAYGDGSALLSVRSHSGSVVILKK